METPFQKFIKNCHLNFSFIDTSIIPSIKHYVNIK